MKLLITGAFALNEKFKLELQNLGFEISFHQYEKEQVDTPQKYDAVICNGLFLYNDIKKFTNLKLIQLTSVGYDRIDTEYCKKKNVKLFNAGNAYAIPMAEWAVFQLLSVCKNSKFFIENQSSKKWIKDRQIKELDGKVAAIAGFGNVGKEIAKRLKAFDVKIIAVDIIEPKNAQYDKYFHIANLKEAVNEADILVLTLPLTGETKGIISKEIFDSMKDNGILINISRGAVINEPDLINAVNSNKLYGAGLDVFCEEPLPEDNPLWNCDNFVITPHNSFVGENNLKRLENIIYNNFSNEKE